MNKITTHSHSFYNNGYECIDGIYEKDEVDSILEAIDKADQSKLTFRKNKDLFAVRQFLKEVPEVNQLVFNSALKQLINQLFGSGYFVTKSIYFDKPGLSNWFVAYHQDLTISVNKKVDLPGFGPWTVKQNQFAVQPPLEILKNNFTVRIHLDDTTADNGALKVLKGSHVSGVRRVNELMLNKEHEVICPVNAGGIMLMHPLLFHASDRTINGDRRRVIHIEFSKAELPQGLEWAEKQYLN